MKDIQVSSKWILNLRNLHLIHRIKWIKHRDYKAYIANNTIMYKTLWDVKEGTMSLPWTGTYNAPGTCSGWALTLSLSFPSPCSFLSYHPGNVYLFLKKLWAWGLYICSYRRLDSVGSTVCLARFLSSFRTQTISPAQEGLAWLLFLKWSSFIILGQKIAFISS